MDTKLRASTRLHSLRISQEQWQQAERIAKQHYERTGIQTSPSNILNSLLRRALDTLDD